MSICRLLQDCADTDMNVPGYEPGYESDPNDDSPFANPLGAATRTFDATAKPAGETSNPFSAELGLGSALVGARRSGRKEGANSMPAPMPLAPGGGAGKRMAVPPLSDYEAAVGEVQTLPAYAKLALAVSSTDHQGVKELALNRKSKHETAIEAYDALSRTLEHFRANLHHPTPRSHRYHLRLSTMEVELEARTGHAARGFKQLLALNDAELSTIFEELADDFLLVMELAEVEAAGENVNEQARRRRGWIDAFEGDLSGVEGERRQMVEAELSALMETLIATAHLLPPQLERCAPSRAKPPLARAGGVASARPRAAPPTPPPAAPQIARGDDARRQPADSRQPPGPRAAHVARPLGGGEARQGGSRTMGGAARRVAPAPPRPGAQRVQDVPALGPGRPARRAREAARRDRRAADVLSRAA